MDNGLKEMARARLYSETAFADVSFFSSHGKGQKHRLA